MRTPDASPGASNRSNNQVNQICLTIIGQAQAAVKLLVGVEPFI